MVCCSSKYYVIVLIILQSLLADDQVASAPVVILGNKIDRPGAVSEDELRTLFNLHGQTTGKVIVCRWTRDSRSV